MLIFFLIMQNVWKQRIYMHKTVAIKLVLAQKESDTVF